ANASQETQANSSQTPNFKQAQSTYGVAIKPNSLSLQASSKKCAVRSGMEGKVDIIAKEETVLRFILRKARLLVDV
ncbi:MAG: HlyD family secretion protein, partial [Waterburya sp.]